jgi:prepilin-type processing-associated H-X9-DG protein
MAIMNIPRHGRWPAGQVTHWPASQALPGKVNTGFLDGHAEAVRLDDLWQLHWHRGYVPPAQRPGLP